MKMSLTKSLFVTTLMSLNLVYAETATVLDPACLTENNDQYATGARMADTTYSYAGQCVDSFKFRPAMIIKETSAKLVFANYFHNGEYYTFELDKTESIENVFYQVLSFDVVQGITAGHVQMRAKLANPVTIQSQTDVTKTDVVDDIVISFEAARPSDVSYNFALGAMDTYVLVGRVTSGEAKLEEEYAETQQYVLK